MVFWFVFYSIIHHIEVFQKNPILHYNRAKFSGFSHWLNECSQKNPNPTLRTQVVSH